MDEVSLNRIEKEVSNLFANDRLNPIIRMNDALRHLAKYRSIQIAQTLTQKFGNVVLGGPFEGMNFLDSVSEGCYVPKLLGIYESELHRYIDEIVMKKPDVIINVGSAEGYYAVGLKRLLPETEIFAFDIDDNAKEKCMELNKINSTKVIIENEFKPEILNDFKTKKIFIMCDIEGDEINLFNNKNINLYEHAEICMELHYKDNNHNVRIMPDIFKNTHKTNLIWQKGKDFEVPDIISNISHLDILLSAWEWRSYPTPWLIAKPLH